MLVMKKVFRLLIGIVLLGSVASSCTPARMFALNTNGIATYNRHTGQFEVLWEWAENPEKVVHDTIFVDSCRIAESKSY